MTEPLSPPQRQIPARNRRQVMDWSLVLASQGIEHVIEPPEIAGWALTVAEADHERALAVIRQYRVENRHWRWRQPVFEPGLYFDWSSAAYVLLIIAFYWWSAVATDLPDLGRTDGAAQARGEWWRLFTATWLHADLGHLATNAVFGFVFLGLAMGRYGPGVGLLAAYLAGIGGNLAGWYIYGAGQRSLGASGVVMGALGLVTFQSWSLLKQGNPQATKLFAGGIAGGLLLFVMLGTGPGTDIAAHFGGFVAGMLLGSGLTLAPRFTHKPSVSLAGGIIFAALVVLPWLRVLAQHH